MMAGLVRCKYQHEQIDIHVLSDAANAASYATADATTSSLPTSATIDDLTRLLCTRFALDPTRCKLIGLPKTVSSSPSAAVTVTSTTRLGDLVEVGNVAATAPRTIKLIAIGPRLELVHTMREQEARAEHQQRLERAQRTRQRLALLRRYVRDLCDSFRRQRLIERQSRRWRIQRELQQRRREQELREDELRREQRWRESQGGSNPSSSNNNGGERGDNDAYDDNQSLTTATTTPSPPLEATSSGTPATFELHALSSPEANASGKIILPAFVLQAIIHRGVPFPITFVVEPCDSSPAAASRSPSPSSAPSPSPTHAHDEQHNTDSNGSNSDVTMSSPPPTTTTGDVDAPAHPPQSYLAVQDYSAPQPTLCFVPASVLAELRVAEGARVRLTTCTLPSATHLTLQPLTRAFMRLDERERRAWLEFSLRRLTFLRQGQRLSFPFRRGQRSLDFIVRECQPAPVVSIVHADADTQLVASPDGEDVAAEDDGEGDVEVVRVPSPSAPSSSSSSSSNTPDASTSVPTSVHTMHMREGQEYAYAELSMDDPNVIYAIAVDVRVPSASSSSSSTASSSSSTTASSSRSLPTQRTPVVDLYISFCVERPSLFDCDAWVETGTDRVLRVGSSLAAFRTGVAWLAVRRTDPADRSTAIDLALSFTVASGHPTTTAAQSTTSSTTNSAAPPTTRTCPNCQRDIPAASFTLHQVQCARLNYRCTKCTTAAAVVMPPHDRAKHDALYHTPHACPCGEFTGELPLVRAHRRDKCTHSLVACSYCPMRVSLGDRGEHQHACGAIATACPECAQPIQRKFMRRHLHREHGKGAAESDLSWGAWWI